MALAFNEQCKSIFNYQRVIEKEIANWQTEMYQMEKACAMFITSKNVKDRMTGRMNYISTERTRLKNELAELKRKYRDAQ